MIQIIPLAEERLEETVSLADEVFPPEYEEEPAKVEIPASLFPEAAQDFFSRTGIQSDLKYWVAINGKNKVVGMVGLYRYATDDDAEWLGWYLVAPSVRKSGIGTELLLFAIEEAKRGGKKFLRLYSTTDPEELDAHRLFQKYGFRLVKEEPWEPDPELTKLIFELDLRAQVS